MIGVTGTGVVCFCSLQVSIFVILIKTILFMGMIVLLMRKLALFISPMNLFFSCRLGSDAGHEAAGHGKLDYDRYLSLLHAYGFRGPLLLHGLSETQVAGCVDFLRGKLARVAAADTKAGNTAR